jgi:hypothetical protein
MQQWRTQPTTAQLFFNLAPPQVRPTLREWADMRAAKLLLHSAVVGFPRKQ